MAPAHPSHAAKPTRLASRDERHDTHDTHDKASAKKRKASGKSAPAVDTDVALLAALLTHTRPALADDAGKATPRRCEGGAAACKTAAGKD